MKNPGLILALCAAALWNVDGNAAQPDYAYLTTVRLADGKKLNCAVNEPLGAADPSVPLSRREQTEAGVLATQRLRLLGGPTSDYPSPYTAPNVTCGVAG